MGKNLKDDEIVIPQNEHTSRPIPPDTPGHMIQHIMVEKDGETYPYQIVKGSNGTRVGGIKDDLDADDRLAVYTDATGRTITLNNDDVIAEYVGEGETLALDTNSKFG